MVLGSSSQSGRYSRLGGPFQGSHSQAQGSLCPLQVRSRGIPGRHSLPTYLARQSQVSILHGDPPVQKGPGRQGEAMSHCTAGKGCQGISSRLVLQ
jgi:hypothetical protein